MTLKSVPIIDLSPFIEGDEAGKRRVAAQVDETCRQVGFLVITNHGIDSALSDALFDKGYQFFDLPVEKKLKVRKERGAAGNGYHPFATEKNDTKMEAEDLRESFGMARPGSAASALNRWPEEPAGFKQACLNYYSAMERLGYSITGMFAMALGLPEKYFMPMVDSPDCMMLVHHYPAQKTPPLPNQLRSGAHSDIGLFTMLRTEREHKPGGLQVQIDGNWVDVPAVKDSFVINIGDTMMRWTNDRWVSTLHRVVNPPRESAGSSRISIPIFFNSNPDAVLECLPSCCSADNPAKYPPVIAREYRMANLGQTYEPGRP